MTLRYLPSSDLIGARWRKSSRSENAAYCVELTPLTGVHWRKSSRSHNAAGCVELAITAPGTAIRDSKSPDGPALLFPAPAVPALLSTLTT
jgi:hypothetical protein